MLVYILLLFILILVLLLVWALKSKPHLNQELVDLNRTLMSQNRELLNRLQAPDLKTFQVLQTSSILEDNVKHIPRDDESEYNQLRDSNASASQFLSTDDVRNYAIEDFGLGLSADGLLRLGKDE